MTSHSFFCIGLFFIFNSYRFLHCCKPDFNGPDTFFAPISLLERLIAMRGILLFPPIACSRIPNCSSVTLLFATLISSNCWNCWSAVDRFFTEARSSLHPGSNRDLKECDKLVKELVRFDKIHEVDDKSIFDSNPTLPRLSMNWPINFDVSPSNEFPPRYSSCIDKHMDLFSAILCTRLLEN